MSRVNDGFVFINEQQIASDESASLCVLGMPRGGTTMCVRMLQQSGIFMGADLPVNAEDPAFSKLLKQRQPRRDRFLDLVRERASNHRRWGFKAPYRNHWDLLEAMPAVRFLVIFRDVLSVANRNRISVGADTVSSMQANLAVQQDIVRFLARSSRPQLLISYEKALLAPDKIASAVLRFAGSEAGQGAIDKVVDLIRPNDADYVMSEQTGGRSTVVRVDHVSERRLSGWARAADGGQVTLVFKVDGETVATVLADSERRDLAKHFQSHGKYGFNVDLGVPAPGGSRGEVTISDAGDGKIYRRF